MSLARCSRRYSIKTSTHFLSHHITQFRMMYWDYLLDKWLSSFTWSWPMLTGLLALLTTRVSNWPFTGVPSVMLVWNLLVSFHPVTKTYSPKECAFKHQVALHKAEIMSTTLLATFTHFRITWQLTLKLNNEPPTDYFRVLLLGHLLLFWGGYSFPSNQKYTVKPVCLSLN